MVVAASTRDLAKRDSRCDSLLKMFAPRYSNRPDRTGFECEPRINRKSCGIARRHLSNMVTQFVS